MKKTKKRTAFFCFFYGPLLVKTRNYEKNLSSSSSVLSMNRNPFRVGTSPCDQRSANGDPSFFCTKKFADWLVLCHVVMYWREVDRIAGSYLLLLLACLSFCLIFVSLHFLKKIFCVRPWNQEWNIVFANFVCLVAKSLKHWHLRLSYRRVRRVSCQCRGDIRFSLFLMNYNIIMKQKPGRIDFPDYFFPDFTRGVIHFNLFVSGLCDFFVTD